MSLPITEDTPPDMLAGSMDLKVILPDGRTVKMSIQRGTPMMDLLVQITTAHCLSPGDYSLQAMGDKGVLPFKPSTPIGVLDTFTVKIVEKKMQSRGKAPQVPQSFLNTFRLQVHLPRSQLFVIRVTPDFTLSEIMTHICTEKNLNLEKYEFRNPGNLDEVLELDKTLGHYKLQELTMMSKGNRAVTGLMSSADIINVKSSKHRQNSVCDSSLSSGSYGSRSGSPVPPINVVSLPPQPPIRKKRRPAPKPPAFLENEKKEQNTTSSVLISHSRESSDSSGYHEASVLSESPTHGRPPGTTENESPPDTLPRRTQLPPSHSFTNLTSIQPAPRPRLTNSVSNTSLNSNGHCRKKRAPPPPPVRREDKIKSSTLPIALREERRTVSSFMNDSTFQQFKDESPLQVSNAKVQSPVETSTDVVNETKASKDEVPASASLDLDVKLPPKPKPRTILSDSEATAPKNSTQSNLVALDLAQEKCKQVARDSGKLNKWNDFEDLTEESNEDSVKISKEQKSLSDASACCSYGSVCVKDVKTSLVAGTPEERAESLENQEQTDHESINWEYQLPPPPTDFRDSSSPSCTEFGTITINPDILENIDDPEERFLKKTDPVKNSNKIEHHYNEEKAIQEKEEFDHHLNSFSPDKKVSQNKSKVMNELTNMLNGDKKFREKSLSVSNLYINDSNAKDLKKNSLNYSRSFSTDPISTLENFKFSAYAENGLENNKKLSTSNEHIFNNEITYKNFKNLEKCSSMECIQTKNLDTQPKFIEKTEDVFRKPVAPVQKKLKVAKRSASSVGVNTQNSQKKNVEISQNGDSWSDDTNIDVLREQFLEFLKEKKLMNSDLNMKSLDVIRNILPELKEDSGNINTNIKNNVNENATNYSQEKANPMEKEKRSEGDRVKIVDVKVKGSIPMEDDVILRRDVKKESKSETLLQRESLKPPEKKEISKRYSYQGPPSINFSTWGERPKTTTRIIIKDEDYVTQEKITEKKAEVGMKKHVETSSQVKPKEVKKPAQIVIKKPGVMSHYEMFSALPRRKEVSSLELVHMEDEEKKKKMESKESNRVPVVCGVELKKEFKSSSPLKSRFASPEPETSKLKHSTSVYVNGNQDHEKITNSTPCYSLILPKRNLTVMPVVKGFRNLEETPATNHVNISNSSCHINVNISNKINDSSTISHSKSPAKRQLAAPAPVPPPPPPPPPHFNSVKLKPVVSSPPGKPRAVIQDARGQLLEEIRNFGGRRKLKKSSSLY